MIQDYLSPALLCDFYKLSHRAMYPKGTEYVYSTWTPRISRIEGINYVVAFGMQMAVTKLKQYFDNNFFTQPLDFVIDDYCELIKHSFGGANPDVSHLKELHALKHLPLHIKALPEGMRVPLRVPYLTIENTDPRFFWLTNYVETFLSAELWQASTSATIAHEYRILFDLFADMTVGDRGHVGFQGHDFSMRGMSSLESAVSSGLGHLLSFYGSDSIPAIQGAEYFYNANLNDEMLIGTSIPASEHSVQCAYGDDMAYFRQLINDVHPSGFVSIVSDGYDFWQVIGEVVPALKDDIMKRVGRVVIRPDSGDPVKIICGDPEGATELERKGAIEALWDTFGGTITDKGYKQLDTHIGLIYGEAIRLERACEILKLLMHKGFASSNVVFGIGSYTYQYNTRDTFGFAMKSTWCQIDGKEKLIFKAPKTDTGLKASQKGRVAVVYDNGTLVAKDQLSINETVPGDLLNTIFIDGHDTQVSFANIRKRLGRLA